MAEANEITGILNKYGSLISAELVDMIQRKPVTKFGVVNASGKLKDSVHFTVANNVMQVKALSYIYYLEKGRKPGKRPPMKVIEQWITDKGLILEGISKKSLAFLIARKIGEEGTTIYEQGGSTLIADIVDDEMRGQIQSQLILTFREKTNALMRSAIVGR